MLPSPAGIQPLAASKVHQIQRAFAHLAGVCSVSTECESEERSFIRVAVTMRREFAIARRERTWAGERSCRTTTVFDLCFFSRTHGDTYDLKELTFEGALQAHPFLFTSSALCKLRYFFKVLFLGAFAVQIPESSTLVWMCVKHEINMGDYSIETEVPGIFPFLARRALTCRAEHNLPMLSLIRIRHVCQCRHPCLLVVRARDVRE
jgi:hypothetical protein